MRHAHSSSGTMVLPPRRPPPPESSPPPEINWGTRLRWGVVILAVLAFVLYLTWSVISVLFASVVFAYLLHPLLNRFEKRGFSREFGLIVLSLSVALAALVGVLILVPAVARQMNELSSNLGPYIERLSTQIGPWKAEIEGRLDIHIPVDFSELSAMLPDLVRRISPDTRQTITDGIGAIASGGIGFIGQIVQVSLVFPFTFFLARDWPNLISALFGLVPARWQPRVHTIAAEIDGRLMAFVQGQILVCGALGVLYSIGLVISGIDLAITIGLASGVLYVVPYLGTVVGVVLSVSLALLKFGLDWHVVMCIATFIVAQLIEGFVLTPFLVGDKVGLHPMVVIVALIVGGNLLGFAGLILALPLTAVLAVLGAALVETYRKSHFYRG